MKKLLSLCLLALVAQPLACYPARAPYEYRMATQTLLATRSAAIGNCYDGLLKTAPADRGTVVVDFTVEGKTGNLLSPAVNTAASTAPADVQSCVLTNLTGLVLSPPDGYDAPAAFVWDFEPSGPALPSATPQPHG